MNNTTRAGARHVVILGTGGTISGRAASADDNIGYTAGEVGVADLLVGIEAPAGIALVAEQVAQVDSKDMDFAVWQALVSRCAHWLAQPDVVGIVITHGTDTLEETAYFLQAVLSPDKPVVLTCAMRPATALSPDGPQNVRDGIVVAATPGARGVCAVCAGTVHSALDVKKVHTYRLDAFASGDAGPIGYVEEGAVRPVRSWPEARAAGSQAAVDKIAAVTAVPRIEIVVSHAGAGGAMVDALMASPTAHEKTGPLRGLVIAATGNGTVHHVLEAAALRAQAAGVAVVRATRCVEGRILARPGESLRDAGALTPVKARIALMLELLGLPRAER
ncbi:asparaginase [Variovorax sp. PAMC 28711]|uniref:asparaginase n=1 Tax=Variovorax sp. PAMC 28711 TaxID=1795631 RepID=UPI00078B507B|nr:asparaginase [Variovorax sp. PAMC 28711]AMM26203.1 L-asparaginase [Variovorax sp. PAMC 28711]